MMKRRKDKNKGVLTVEAAIILPIFIMVMVFILSILKLVYFHAVMQQALQNVGVTLAQYAYVVDEIVDLQEFALKEKTKEKETALVDGVGNVMTSGGAVVNSLSTAFTFEEGANVVDKVTHLISKVNDIIEQGGQFKTDLTDLIEVIKQVEGKDILNYLIASAMNEVTDPFVAWMVGDYLTAMEAKTGAIQNITYALYIEDGTKDMILAVDYDYNFDFFFIDTIRLQQMVRVHPWVGGETEGIYEPLIK